MRKITGLMTILLVFCLFSAAVFAADGPKRAGIYDLKAEKKHASFVRLEARTVEDQTIQGRPAAIDGAETTFYPSAEKIRFVYSWAEKGREYLVTVQKGADSAPTADSLVYLDHGTADSSSIEFNLFPGSLEAGEQYGIYISGNTPDGFAPMKLAASFRYYGGPEDSEFGYGPISEIRRMLQASLQQVLSTR